MSRPMSRLSMLVAASLLSIASVQASSHREAPFITTAPKVDATDFFMFRSYELTLRSGGPFLQ